MTKTLNINITDIKKENRFNPKFFYFLLKKNKIIARNSNSFVSIGDKSYFPLVSDGIHSKVSIETYGNIRYLYTHSLKEGFVDITDTIYLDTNDFYKNSSKRIQQDWVLLSVVGSLGNVAIFTDYIKEITSLPRNIAYIETNRSKIYPEYLLSFFLSDFAKKQAFYSGGGNIQGLISLNKLKKFNVYIPELNIQIQYQQKIKEAQALQKQFIEQINDIKNEFKNFLFKNTIESSFKKNFEVSIKEIKKGNLYTPAFYNPYSDEILNELEKHFKTVELCSIGSFEKGDEIGSDNYYEYIEKPIDAIPFIRTSDIYNYEIDSYPSYYADKSIYNNLKQDFRTGDIIINNDGKIGYFSIITKEDNNIYQSHIKRYRVNTDITYINNYYVFLCLLLKEIGEVQFKKNTVVQSTIPTLSNRIEKIKIPLIDEKHVKYFSQKIENSFKLLEQKKIIMKNVRIEINKLLQNL